MILNLSSYYIPAAAAPARVTLIVTSFLTSTFILKASTERTVKLSFMNPMQLFLTVNIMFIVASMVQYIIVLTTSRRMKVSIELNRMFQKENTFCVILDFFIDKENDRFLRWFFFRSNCSESFYKIGVLKNLAKFTEKKLC